MCGFVGYFPSLNTETDYLYLNKMLKNIRYRGPDKTNIYRNDKIALGHHRLSIIDLKGGQQPVIDKSSGDCLVYNGEIYNFKSQSEFLKEKGVRLEEKSDTEVLFKLLTNFGIKSTLEKIDGMFSFVFFSAKENSLYLVRDRAGEKPLYYANYKNFIIFGSELKAVTNFPHLKKNINFSAINEYLYLDYIPFSQTLITEIKKVLPGHYLKYSPKSQKLVKYWQLNLNRKNEYTFSKNLNILDNLLDKSVKNRLIADVPVGLFLSGGIDSSLIAHYCKNHSTNIKTFTIKMPSKSYDEYDHALNVSEHLGLKNYHVTLNEKELLKALFEIENNIDEPVNDPSLLPTYLVSKLAKNHVKVALSGDGADELFSGYAPFNYLKALKVLSFFPKDLGKFLYYILKNIRVKDNYMSLFFLLKNISKGLGYRPEQQIFKWMAPFNDHEIRKLFSEDFNKQYFEKNTLFENLYSKSYLNGLDLHDKISSLFFNNYLCDDLLTKVDRTSMLNSLEVRSPFLEKNIMNFSSSIKNKYKVNGTTKYILRQLSKNRLPKKIVQRKKHGFAIPLAKMLRGVLKDKVTDTLTSSDANILSFTNKKALRNILEKHNKGLDNRKMIWSLYILEKSIKNILYKS
tara:strand:- start:633 stop:2513 length:1881 start_codon:yes stop_codon:yes gene_type:complete